MIVIVIFVEVVVGFFMFNEYVLLFMLFVFNCCDGGDYVVVVVDC